MSRRGEGGETRFNGLMGGSWAKKQTDPYILLSYLFMFLIRFTE
ncbi:hypothetical protein EMIT0373P_60087 [Pseudomonas chlororaphis]